MHKGSFELSVLVNGKQVREYCHEGRFYFEAREGSEFEVFIRNLSSRRAEAVISVDGLDVLDGEPANSKKEGYLVPPYGTLKIDGWRINSDEVARFQVSGLGGAYASVKGKARNIGVIGVAVYYEKEYPKFVYNPSNFVSNTGISYTDSGILRGMSKNIGAATTGISLDDSVTLSNTGGAVMDSMSIPCSAPVSDNDFEPTKTKSIKPASFKCSMSNHSRSSSRTYERAKGASMSSAGVGTSFGRKAESKVTYVSFERAGENPDEMIEIRYNDRENLEKLGIKIAQPVDEKLAQRELASPFEDLEKGCKPPPGWRG